MRWLQPLSMMGLLSLANLAQAQILPGGISPTEIIDLLWATAVPVVAGGAFVFVLRELQARRFSDGQRQSNRIRLYQGPLLWSLCLMAVGLALTISIATRMRISAQEEARSFFNLRALEVERDFRERFSNLTHILNGVRGAFLASNYVSRNEFHQMIAATELETRIRGVQGLSFTERIMRSDLRAYEARQRREGATGFTIRSQSVSPDLFVVKYIEPMQGNASALGFDIGSEAKRRDVAEQSMRSGLPMLTSRVTLAQDPLKRAGALLMLPLYKAWPIPVTQDARVSLMSGWIVAPIIFQELLAENGQGTEQWVRFQVYEDESLSPASLLFDSSSEASAPVTPVQSGEQGGRYSAVRQATAFNRIYHIKVESTPAFDALQTSATARQTAFLGASLSVLAAMVLWLLMVGRNRTLEMAQRMTHDLNRLALVARRTSNAVIFAGPERDVTWVNEGFTRFSGLNTEAVQGMPISEVLQCEASELDAYLDDAIGSGKGKQIRSQHPFKGQNGNEYRLDQEVQSLYDERGQLSGFMAVLTDVTQEVKAREALQREKDRAANILSGTNVGTWESNLITGESNWNERWGSMMGFSTEEIVPSADVFWQTRLHPDDRVRINNGMSRCIRGIDERYAIDVRAQRKDGSWMWILSRAKVMSRAPDGRVEWIGGVHTDITESKTVELNLRDTEAFMDRAGHISGVGGWQFNIKSGQIFLTEQTRSIYGFDADHHPTLHEVFSRYPVAERKRLRKAISNAIKNGTAWDLILEFRNIAGTLKWVRLFGEVEYDDSGAVRLVGAFQDVTREHNAQLEIKRSSELLKGAIDAINEAFVVYDPQDKMVYCNDKYRALYDKTADLMVPGVSFETLIRAGAERGQYMEALGRIEEWVQERLAVHRTADLSMEQRLGNGRWLKVVERKMADGHTVGFRVDITELKNAVADAETANIKLAEEQRRLQNILDGTGVGTWEWNLQADELSLSEQWAEMVGYDRNALQEPGLMLWKRLAHPQDLEEASRRLQAHLDGLTPIYDAEVRMQHKNGGWVWILVRGKLTRRDDRGQPLRVSGTHMDISVRKQAEQALADTSATLQSVLDSAVNVGIVTTDLSRIIRVFNRGAENLLGYSAEEIIGKVSGSAFFDVQEIEALMESQALMLGRAPTPQETFEHVVTNSEQAEWTLVRRDKTRFKANLLFSSLCNAGGELTGYLGIIYDISRQKEYEASLRAAMQMAEQSSVAKSQFLANMSHEIRTPMNAILGMLQLMRNTSLTPRQRDYADKTEGAARSLLGLLNDILDFSKVEAGKMQITPEAFRLEDLLCDLSVILSSNLGGKNVDLVFDLDPDIPPVLMGDSLRLKQILINLGGNAVKFTEHGEVVIRWSLLGQNHDRVRLKIAIADTGIGIASENQARIFEGFTQAEANTTRRFGGTGLGLVISSRLVGLMGGKLELNSALGKGTTFSFILDLPVVEADLLTPKAAFQPSDLKVLLVDDNPVARKASAAIMRRLGWNVREADSGVQAVSLLRETLSNTIDPVDAVFIDEQMPALDGWQTVQEIKSLFAGRETPKLILVSGQNREALTRLNGKEQDTLDALMVKPLTATMFVQAAADAMNRSFFKQPAEISVPEGPGRLAGMRVLLVEDNPINQQVAFELLQGEGAKVVLADNGQLGVDALAAANPAFHVVLMDLQMPVMDGLTASRLIRQNPDWNNLPVIAMTANAMAQDREACQAAGMNDHIGKPFDLTNLVAVLHRHTGWKAAGNPPEPDVAATNSPGPIQTMARVPAGDWPEGLEVDAALGRMGGNRSLLQRAIQAFVGDSKEIPGRIAALSAQAQWEKVKRELHSLKGLCATLGLPDLSRQSAAAEQRVSAEGPAEDLNAHLSELWTALKAIIPALKIVAAQLDQPPTQLQVEQPAAVVLDQLKALLAALKESDMHAMEMHAGLRGAIPDELGKHFEALDSAMADLEFEMAAEQCEILIARWSK